LQRPFVHAPHTQTHTHTHAHTQTRTRTHTHTTTGILGEHTSSDAARDGVAILSGVCIFFFLVFLSFCFCLLQVMRIDTELLGARVCVVWFVSQCVFVCVCMCLCVCARSALARHERVRPRFARVFLCLLMCSYRAWGVYYYLNRAFIERQSSPNRVLVGICELTRHAHAADCGRKSFTEFGLRTTTS
jgi:uncharacterized membrane protein (GlpM family)